MAMVDRMLKSREVLELAAISRPTLYRRIKDAEFPKPKVVGPRALRWQESAVREWLANRPDSPALA